MIEMLCRFYVSGIDFVHFYVFSIYIIMWSCPGNMPKYYPGLRDILPDRRGE